MLTTQETRICGYITCSRLNEQVLRLDRFMFSDRWFNVWDYYSQWTLNRGLSDHVSIILCDIQLNWGPHSFRMLQCWSDFEG